MAKAVKKLTESVFFMPKQKNIAIANSLKDKLSKAKSVVLTDYRGLTHKQSEELHRAVKIAGGEFVVAKNSLLRIASTSTDYELPTGELVGPSAALLAYEDELAPLKELAKTIKSLGLPKIKFGIISGQKYSETEVDAISKLPAKEVLQAQLVSRLSSPLYGLAYSLNYTLQKLVIVLEGVKNRV